MCQQCGNNICGGCQPIIPSGLNGVDGINAFNFTTASFSMPAVNSNVTVNVKAINPFKNSWFAVGQVVFIETAGYFQVVSIAGSNQVTLENLGYSDANFTPAAPSTTIASNVKVSPAGLIGASGATGGAGANGTTRVAYSLAPVNSGVGASKTFITQSILAVDMPQVEGSSLVLTFNVRTQNSNGGIFDRQIGVTFGGQNCITGGFPTAGQIFISGGQIQTQVKVEIIRSSVATEAYARVSFYGIDFGSGPICYNESNLLSGLNFTNPNNFVIYGIQNQTDTFEFSAITIDKIIAL
jgi:hypothetical protein